MQHQWGKWLNEKNPAARKGPPVQIIVPDIQSFLPVIAPEFNLTPTFYFKQAKSVKDISVLKTPVRKKFKTLSLCGFSAEKYAAKYWFRGEGKGSK